MLSLTQSGMTFHDGNSAIAAIAFVAALLALIGVGRVWLQHWSQGGARSAAAGSGRVPGNAAAPDNVASIRRSTGATVLKG